MLHAVNTQHGLQRIGPSAIARLGIKRLDDSGHILPWQNLLHAGEENLFSGLTALSAEFTIGEGEGNDSNLLIVFYVQIMPDDFVMQLHRF